MRCAPATPGKSCSPGSMSDAAWARSTVYARKLARYSQARRGGTYKELDVKLYNLCLLSFFQETCIQSNSFAHTSLRREPVTHRMDPPVRSRAILWCAKHTLMPLAQSDKLPGPKGRNPGPATPTAHPPPSASAEAQSNLSHLDLLLFSGKSGCHAPIENWPSRVVHADRGGIACVGRSFSVQELRTRAGPSPPTEPDRQPYSYALSTHAWSDQHNSASKRLQLFHMPHSTVSNLRATACRALLVKVPSPSILS